MGIEKAFDENGKIKYDPYRRDEQEVATDILFDEEGELWPGVEEKLAILINEKGWDGSAMR